MYNELNFTEYFCKFNVDDIKKAVKGLNPYKGYDEIHSNHLKNASELFFKVLTDFINACILHSYVPKAITNGVIVPLIKGNFLNKTQMCNYRPIIKSSVFLKIIEIILLSKIEKFFSSSDQQHGFKKKYSTKSAFFVLKETIYNYINFNSPVYAAFLDFSKAFDKVNHAILFDMLHKIGVPRFYIRFIAFIYNNQHVYIEYNGFKSRLWQLGNGVRQGSSLSPFLFSIYINKLVEGVSNLSVGCTLGLFRSNIIAYADDLVVLSPSFTGLQLLLDRCFEFSTFLKLTFNVNKCV